MAFILVSSEHTDNLILCFVKRNCPCIGQIYHLLGFPNNVLETAVSPLSFPVLAPDDGDWGSLQILFGKC